MEKKLRVGVFMRHQKLAKMRWEEIVKEANNRGIDITLIDIDNSLDSQGKFDLLLLKLTEELVTFDTEKSQHRVKLIESYLERNPHVKIIDPIENQKGALNRAVISSMLKKVDSDLVQLNMPFESPNFVIVDKEQDDYTALLAQHSIKFPIIAKAVTACGTEASHIMGILYNEKGLHGTKLKPPMLVQEFKNHNGVIMKVYTIGDHIHVVRRKSLRNVQDNQHEPIIFDSQAFPRELLAADNTLVDDVQQVPNPTEEMLKAMVKALNKHVGMTLMGVDVILCTQSKKFGIIDINYFPGYAGIHNWPSALVDLIVEKAKD